VGNEPSDLGAGGVKIGDERSNANPPAGPNGAGIRQAPGGPNGRENANDAQSETEASSENVVTDNDIHDIGAVFASAVGVWIGQSYGNTVAHNEIRDTYYSGISVGWTWSWGRTMAHHNIIEQNHIHHIGRGLLSDMGCIYTLGLQPGTVLRNNLCHDVTRYDKKPAQRAPGTPASQPLIENQTGYGGWGIYLDSASSQILVENNVVYRTQDGAYHNLYFRADGQPFSFGKLSFEQWQRERGQDRNSLIGDPRFVDPEHGDFTLEPGSPALRIGFQPIDVGHVGPRQKVGIPAGVQSH
jgi:hypothetical protein